MFKEYINTPIYPLTVEYLRKLKRLKEEPDYVLTILGLICFKDRVKNYNGITGLRYYYETKKEAIQHYLSTELGDGIYFDYYVCANMNADASDEEEILSQKGFKHKETVEKIVKEKFGDKISFEILYSENKNAVLVLTKYDDYLDLYHLVLSFLPLYYPNIYTTPISKDDPEVSVLSALSKCTSSLFKKTAGKCLEKYKKEFYFEQLQGLIKQFHIDKINKADVDLQQAEYKMKDLLNRYTQAVEAYHDAVIYKEGVMKTEESDEEEKELVQYLSTNDKIRNVKIIGSDISFTVATTLNQFSTDAWDIFSRNGGIYKGNYGSFTPSGLFARQEDRKLLFDAIFSEDAKLVVKIAGNYCLNISNNRFTTRRDFDYISVDPIYADYLPNPHLKIFACLGQYTNRVTNVLANHDLVTAFELCVHSAGSVDLDETEQTFRPFLGWIMQSTKKILIRTEDNKEMTPAEALLWLTEENEK